MRYDKRYEVGEPGAVYEFNVKIQKVNAPGMTDDDWEHDAMIAREEFEEKLRKRYKWVGRTYFTGRSGGWLAIEDATGKATVKSLKTIDALVEKARRRFKREVEASAATGYFVDLHSGSSNAANRAATHKTVTVIRSGKRFKISFSQLPGKTFGPWDFAETVRDLRISALLEPMEARNLVLEAHANGRATSSVG